MKCYNEGFKKTAGKMPNKGRSNKVGHYMKKGCPNVTQTLQNKCREVGKKRVIEVLTLTVVNLSAVS